LQVQDSIPGIFPASSWPKGSYNLLPQANLKLLQDNPKLSTWLYASSPGKVFYNLTCSLDYLRIFERIQLCPISL
jgi:hypothetical protein